MTLICRFRFMTRPRGTLRSYLRCTDIPYKIFVAGSLALVSPYSSHIFLLLLFIFFFILLLILPTTSFSSTFLFFSPLSPLFCHFFLWLHLYPPPLLHFLLFLVSFLLFSSPLSSPPLVPLSSTTVHPTLYPLSPLSPPPSLPSSFSPFS